MTPDAGLLDLEPNRLDVDLGAMRGNVAALQRLVGPGCDLYVALKCDAYGFGLVPSARALAEAGVNAFCVSRIGDAVALREGGVALPVLLYAGAVVTPELVETVEQYGLTPTILDLASARAFSEHLAGDLPVFLKVDVGLRRLGVEPSGLAPLAVAVAALPRLGVEGIYTHIAVPGDPVPAGFVEQQFELFQTCLAEVEAAGVPVPVRMAASSAVLRLSDRMSLNAVDPGRMLFGVVPSGRVTEGLPFRCALKSLRTRLLQVKAVDDDPRRPGALVAAPPGMRLGVIAMGAGDGLAVASASQVLVRGRRAPIIDPISLEHCRIDLTAIPDAEAGDEVVVIGRQGDDEITLEEVAVRRGLETSRHTIAINIRGSVQRVYAG